MSRYLCAFLIFFLSLGVINAQEDNLFELVGFATLGGGTTGGAGGNEITVSTGTALQEAINEQQDANTPLTIYIDGLITLANSPGLSKIDVKEVSDVSIIGLGDSAVFNGIGLKIYKSNNIIIRNITVHYVTEGEGDCISIEGPADHIWIDHCELYNELEGVDKDYYDGLLDMKKNVDFVTYSWNYLHHSWKAMLVGSSESDTYNRTLTMHHNLFYHINSRLPLFRASTGHFFNNYYSDVVSTAINSRINACAKIENNYFKDVLNPWVSAYSDVLGGGETSGNILDNSPFVYSDDTFELPDCSLDVPYDYEQVLHPAVAVPAIVEAYAGVGKLDLEVGQIYALSTQVAGQGMIKSIPDQQVFESGEEVTLIAIPAEYWTFEGWSGDYNSMADTIQVTMDGHKVITANFATDKLSLDYQVAGQGSITVEPDKAFYDTSDVVVLTAIPENGHEFIGWEGDITSEDNPLELTMTDNTTITAQFRPFPADNITLQIEEVYCELQGSVETEHDGFNGSGFIDFENTSGSDVSIASNLPRPRK